LDVTLNVTPRLKAPAARPPTRGRTRRLCACLVWAGLAGLAGCGGGTQPPEPVVTPLGRPLLVLLGDTETPSALVARQALTDAGYVTLDVRDDGGGTGTETGPPPLLPAITRRCVAAEPVVDCGALVLVGFGAPGAAQVDPLARRWQGGADAPPGWRVRAVLTVGAGYTPPARVMDGVWQRSDLADIRRWQVGMIQSRDDPRAGVCDADGCGVLPLALAHGARSQPIASACPRAGTAGAADPLPDASTWLVAAVRTLLLVAEGRPWPNPPNLENLTTLPINACLADLTRERPPASGPAPTR
jgi:hypothetical protein